jgi:hypothetical protein
MYRGVRQKKNHKERDIGHIEKTLMSLGGADKEVRGRVLECFALNFEGIRNRS